MSAGNPCSTCPSCGEAWREREFLFPHLGLDDSTYTLKCRCGTFVEIPVWGVHRKQVWRCTNPENLPTMTTENKTPANWPDGLRMADRIAEIARNTLLANSQLPNDRERVRLMTAALQEIERVTGGQPTPK